MPSLSIRRVITHVALAGLVTIASTPVHATDILRPTIGATPAADSAPRPSTGGVPATSARLNASDTLARTTQALQAVQTMQAAARSLAIAGPNNLGADPNHIGQTLPNVPDGLGLGGLQVASGVGASWQGADQPTQSASGGKTTVTVKQNTQQALLTWQSFNVGKNTTLKFDQSAGDGGVTEWIAFNRVIDPAGVPSQILGAITAPGQVYVVNQNGIIFGGSSQVNVHSLVASSLPLNDNLVARGLLNNPDQQFLFSAIPVAAGANGTPAFTPAPANTPSGNSGDVVVQAGATLTSPTNADHTGGRIALFGPNVTNAGTISTPDGQTILAAGQQIGLAAHDSNDPTLRGLDVYVGSGGGAVTNAENGLVDAPRASVVMAGKSVNQLGAISSSTSVAYNGRIDLLAEYDAISSGGYAGLAPFFPKSTGTLTLGPSSVTQIVPELTSTDRIVGRQLALASQMNLLGRSIYLAPKATVFAPSGKLSIDAGAWNLTGFGATAQDTFAYTLGQIYVDAGAAIDVSGSADVAASVEENIVSVELRGSELANSPLQRDGALRGQTVKIDVRQSGTYNGQSWVGTSLADTSGYVALVDHTVGELTTSGGSVKLNAGNSVVMQPGSAINVSGGWTNYAGGLVDTTKLLLANGRVVDISQATPDQVYVGIYTGTSKTADPKWGVNATTTDPQLQGVYDPGYIQGGNGGVLSITAPAMALDGSLLGATVTGPHQRTSAPTAAALTLAFHGQDPSLPQKFYPDYSPTPPAIVFGSNAQSAPAPAYSPDQLDIPTPRKQTMTLSPALVGGDAFGSLTLDNPDGSISVPSNVSLSVAAGGAFTFSAANIAIDGALTAPGGSASFTVYDRSPYADRALTGGQVPPPPVAAPSRGNFQLGSTGSINVSGSLVDDRISVGGTQTSPQASGAVAAVPGGDSLAIAPSVTKGGTISINSFSANLAAGSSLDVSGGLSISSAGKVTYANGGSLSIGAGEDPGFGSLVGGGLSLGATLAGYSGAKGGSLSLLAPSVEISSAVASSNEGSAPNASPLRLDPSFFSQGGFASFTISGLGQRSATTGQTTPAVVIAPGTKLDPVVQNRVLTSVRSGTDMATLVEERGVRTPVSLAFKAPGVRDPYAANPVAVRGDIVMGAGASITTDPKGSVSFSGDTVQILGSVRAPGGSISISGSKDSTLLFSDASHAATTVDLGSSSVLSTAGTTVLTPDPRGYRIGSVLAGGTIAVNGNVLAEAGAVLDVSGATGTLDLAPSYTAGLNTGSTSTSGGIVIPTLIDSNGGAITLAGGQQLFTDATLLGHAGGAGAEGGSLTITSGRFYAPGTPVASETPKDVTLTVTQTGATIPMGGASQSPIGATITSAAGAPVTAQGYVAADSFNHGGFGALTLGGTVQFSGLVTLNASRSITAASAGFLFADNTVTLNAPYVALGAPFQTPLLPQELTAAFLVQGQPFYAAPVYGTGVLNVSAKLIDVGNLSLQNIGRANLIADAGDIRGDGTLDVAGDLTLKAGQIYPSTAVSFTVAAFDYNVGGQSHAGSVTIASSGTRPLPLSAGGTLNVYGSTITQGGVLRAPIGTINLGWDGSGAARQDPISNLDFTPTQQLTLASGSITSVSAIDPITNKAMTIPYGLNLNGTSWIDPTSTDITVSGVPQKTVNVSAAKVTDQPNATIDVRGGGDLYAYQWVTGVGGTKDVLASSNSFAVIPGYDANYAPYAPFNPTTLNTNLNGDAGYVNSHLAVGDQVYLVASNGLAAGVYTLLPARYALLPGAFLVTPKAGVPPDGATAQPDGATLVAGYRFNGFDAARTVAPINAAFEVAPQSVVRQRAEYDDSSANTFLAQGARDHDAAVPRLPVDAGQLVFTATKDMSLQGVVAAQSATGGRGGLVDISSPVDIVISNNPNTASTGVLALSASDVSAFGAESLLIGGVRHSTTDGTVVSVASNNVTLDNAGTPLKGSDITLVADKAVILKAGAAIDTSGGTATGVDTLVLGDAKTAGSGDGALVRVSSDGTAAISRVGTDNASSPDLILGGGVQLTGQGIVLDSTSATSLDASAALNAKSLTLDSGQITLQLAAGAAPTNQSGLVLSRAALEGLASADRLSLLSYSTIDIYGAGQIGALDASGVPTLGSLALHTGEIRGFNTFGGSIGVNARDLLIDNAANAIATGATASGSGSLVFNAQTLRLGANSLAIDQFSKVTFNAAAGVTAQGVGTLTTQGALTINSPVLTGATAADHAIQSSGALTLVSATGSNSTTAVAGLGASLTFTGATVSDDTSVVLPSGALTLRATAGDVQVAAASGANLDVAGTSQAFNDVTKYTHGGTITLLADAGSVNLGVGATLSVAANGDAHSGSFVVAAPSGAFRTSAILLGGGGDVSLDVGHLTGSSLADIDHAFGAGGFTGSQSLRIRTGNVVVDDLVKATTVNLSIDAGSITVTGSGVIDASGAKGGTIDLEAAGSVVLQSGAKLTVAGQDFSAAGKGGAVSLETRGANGGTIDIQSGSTIDLSVASNRADATALGKTAGTLHLRAPQAGAGNDVAIAPIAGSLLGGSSVVVEGYHVFDLTLSGGVIDDTVRADVKMNGDAFAANRAAITVRLTGGQSGVAALLHVRPGAELVNRAGDLTLADPWDLSTLRFGATPEPGVLTLRATGNLNFDYAFNSVFQTATIGSLSDGFGGTSSYGLWDAPLLATGTQSWSYRLVAGADLTAADFRRVLPLAALSANSGSLLLGRNAPPLPLPSNPNSPTASSNFRNSIIPQFYQVIRTGTGDIDIYAGRDVQLLNPLATIYTAGTQAAPMANFDVPNVAEPLRNSKLGPNQTPIYPAQYTLGGGSVTIVAQNDIAHRVNQSGTMIEDSSLEMPTNWLYRRGHVDPATGQFGATHAGGEIASTSWWVDFSNFFEGVGALGGGDVTLTAGRDIANVDAVVPTNARMPKGAPDAAKLVELGGGDLVIRAGRDINAGTYYVECGTGELTAGGSIHTNSTRAAVTQADVIAYQAQQQVPDATNWLPTTLFLGQGRFDVAANGDLLLGSVANPFLLPQGINNNAYEKTYFSTFATDSAVNVASLTGALTLRDATDTRTGSLAAWYQNVLLYDPAHHATFSSYSQPWLRLLETDTTPFLTVARLMPGTLRATAFTGDLNLVGGMTLSPAPSGTIDLLAGKSINALQVNGLNTITGDQIWGASLVNLSDADPSRVPGITTPLALSASAAATPTITPIDVLDGVNALFNESGSTAGIYGVIQTKQALHAAGPLHAADPEPAHLYAKSGDISGLTLFAGKPTDVVAGRDLTDISLYLQNVRPEDVSVVAAGRDLIAFDMNSPLRLTAQSAGNELLQSSVTTPAPGGGNPNAGDIQIGGPGTLEVLAGRNFTLGIGPSAGDGTTVGITSIGNARNPNLPFAGASIVAGAGIGAAANLNTSAADFAAFDQQFLNPTSAGGNATRYLPELGKLLSLPSASDADVWSAYSKLAPERRHALALQVFYDVLRDAGRDHGKPSSAGFGNYSNGYAAIAALFPGTKWKGDMSLTSREIKTANGGNIDVFVPGGALTVGLNVSGNNAVDEGILTETGGNISIFSQGSVAVGTSRIFTLRGGNEIIWSSKGNIAAGVSSKTIQSAPPTRVLVDPQSGDVKTDLAGLATGGGIGVLATVAGVAPGDVDLIAPTGTIDAGDAGIRVSGNLNVSALQVVNASNIQVSGTAVGTPTVAAPSLGGLMAATSVAAAASNAANDVARQAATQAEPVQLPSVITVEVIGYGGGDNGGVSANTRAPGSIQNRDPDV